MIDRKVAINFSAVFCSYPFTLTIKPDDRPTFLIQRYQIGMKIYQDLIKMDGQ
jgi:hypothetical protein